MALEIGWKKLLEDNFHLFEPGSGLELDDFLAIDLNGNNRYEGIGLIYLRMGNFEEAIENLSAAISIQETPSAYINRAIACSELAKTREGSEARRLLRQAERDNRMAAELTEK